MRTRFALLLFIVSITAIILYRPFPHEVFATSPSFGNQEIRDPFHDVIDLRCLANHPININQCENSNQGNQSIDTAAVDYSSDGSVLNATIWLNSALNENITSNQEETNYGMFIDADSNEKTGWQGIDYQVENSLKNGKWNRTFEEVSRLADIRILEQKKNFLGFVEEPQKYIPIYVDLSTMGYPNKYRVMLYSEEKIGKPGCSLDCSFWKMDFSGWIDIPPPEIGLLSTPDHVVIRPGEQGTFGIQLTSNGSVVPQVSNFTAKENFPNVQLSFLPNTLSDSPSFNEPESLEIKISENAEVGRYNIPIFANVTKVSTIPNFFNLKNIPLNTAYEIDETSLPITIIKRMNAAELLADFNNTWIQPLSGIYTFIAGLFAGGLGPWLYKIITGKRNDGNNKQKK